MSLSKPDVRSMAEALGRGRFDAIQALPGAHFGEKLARAIDAGLQALAGVKRGP